MERESFEISDASKKSSLIKYSIVIFILGLFFDVRLFLDIVFIRVSGDYINQVYAALVTIAAISATILTLVINSFTDKHYGFSMKEIANFDNDYIKISYVIPSSLLSIVLATLLLALGMINSLVGILMIVVLLISMSSYYSWKLISDDNFCENIVLNHITDTMNNNESEVDNLLNRLYEDFEMSVENHGLLYVDNYIELITEILSKAELTEKTVVMNDDKIKRMFLIVSGSVGYLPAIDKILQLYNVTDSEFDYFDRRELLLAPLQNIQYLNDKELASSSLIEIPKGLETQKVLNKSEKIMILYNYFANVYSNEIITKRLKYNLIQRIISHLSYYSNEDNYEYNSIQQKTLLLIVKNYILTNISTKEAEYLTIRISESLYSTIIYNENIQFYETISLIYTIFYTYSKLETETIKETHRDNIKALISKTNQSIHTNDISFQKLISNNFEGVVTALWNIPDTVYDNLSFFDYFPPRFGAKSIVWEKSALVKFSIYNYLLSYYDFSFPPYLMISDWEEREDKKYYISIFLKMFDPRTKQIKNQEIEKLNEISKWIDKDYTLVIDVQKQMFNKLNEDISQIVEREVNDLKITTPQVTTLNKLLGQRLNEGNFYGYNQKLSLAETKLMYFRPTIVNLEFENDESSIVAKLIRYFERFLNDEVSKFYPEISLSFDSAGVSKLLEKLEKGKFEKRNYTYVNDLALDKQTIETPEFKQLEEIINNIEIINTKPINSNMFFDEGYLAYNLEIVSHDYEILTAEEISNFVDTFKVAERLYKVEDAYLNKSKAMEIVKQKYRKEMVSFKYVIKFDQDKGIRIGFDYRNI